MEAGHHVLLQLPDGVDEGRIAAQAAEHSIGVRGVDEYRVQADGGEPREPWPAALVIGFGNVTLSRIQHGIGVLGSLVAADLS